MGTRTNSHIRITRHSGGGNPPLSIVPPLKSQKPAPAPKPIKFSYAELQAQTGHVPERKYHELLTQYMKLGRKAGQVALISTGTGKNIIHRDIFTLIVPLDLASDIVFELEDMYGSGQQLMLRVIQKNADKTGLYAEQLRQIIVKPGRFIDAGNITPDGHQLTEQFMSLLQQRFSNQ